MTETLPQTDRTQPATLELSIVMPCLNEAETIATCVRKAMRFLADNGVAGEVVIADNGSTDGSQAIAAEEGARVVAVERRGYGNALMGGIEAARGRYVIMGDADDSYDFLALGPFLEKLREGYDLVMGNRFRGGIAPGAMPPLHRYLGNPVLSTAGRLFFRTRIGDFHCGLRGFSRDAYRRLDLQTTGMEFASEMVAKASIHGLRVTEVPTTLSPDGRGRPPHLRSWRDGWRHLRFMLLYSPRWLFLYPGAALAGIGLLAVLWLLPSSREVGGLRLDVHTLLYAALAVILGYQAVVFAVFTKVFAVREGLLPPHPTMEKLFERIGLEAGLVLGIVLIAAGFVLSLVAVFDWHATGFGALDYAQVMRTTIPAMLMMTVGAQTVLASFFLSVLGLRRRGHAIT